MMVNTQDTINSLEYRISEYFQCGGMWNPELMNADQVRLILLDTLELLRLLKL